jgi:hypothetical protein
MKLNSIQINIQINFKKTQKTEGNKLSAAHETGIQ